MEKINNMFKWTNTPEWFKSVVEEEIFQTGDVHRVTFSQQ